MDLWISPPLVLHGQTVDLVSLDSSHVDELELIARDPRIWEFYLVDASKPDTFRKHYEKAFAERDAGREFPFVIFHKEQQRLIGSTRYLQMEQEHSKLEIGWTWLVPEFWHTHVNTECKNLLLTHCFETLKTRRVQLITDENNIRSRKAIAKIGATFEGVLRNDMTRENGTQRNTVVFSIIDSEWPIRRPSSDATLI